MSEWLSLALFSVAYIAAGVLVAGTFEGWMSRRHGPPPEDCEGGEVALVVLWPLIPLGFVAFALLCVPVLAYGAISRWAAGGHGDEAAAESAPLFNSSKADS